jgi:hypothetical protein
MKLEGKLVNDGVNDYAPGDNVEIELPPVDTEKLKHGTKALIEVTMSWATDDYFACDICSGWLSKERIVAVLSPEPPKGIDWQSLKVQDPFNYEDNADKLDKLVEIVKGLVEK